MGFEVQEKFKHLAEMCFGPEDAKHFYRYQGDVFCIRSSCDGCRFKEECTFMDAKLEEDPLPNVRRGMAVENESFLVLFPTVELQNIPILTEDQRMSFVSSNLHFIFQNRKDKFYVFKGQARYYGSVEEFEASEYASYFKVLKAYEPRLKPVSLDYSAIEPRLATMVTREPNWVEVFVGSEKIVAKRIELSDTEVKLPEYILRRGESTFCYLKGELDKNAYEDQCAKCPLTSTCKTLENFSRRVAGDFHSKNAEAFYLSEFLGQTDVYKKKAMRSDAKMGGLALLYGAFEKTLARVLGCSVEKARVIKDNFFMKLPVVKKFMEEQKKLAAKEKIAKNLFNRFYNLKGLLDNGLQYAANSVALNHPIQSLGADFLKYGMMESYKYIRENNLTPYGTLPINEKLNIFDETKLTQIASVHDEVVYLIDEREMEALIPKLYERMRLDYLMDKFKLSFYLEMDCEYDNYRSWTSSARFDTGKIFILSELEKLDAGITQAFTLSTNTLVVDLETLTEEKLNTILVNKKEEGFLLGLQTGESVYCSGFFVDEELLKSLEIAYKTACIKF